MAVIPAWSRASLGAVGIASASIAGLSWLMGAGRAAPVSVAITFFLVLACWMLVMRKALNDVGKHPSQFSAPEDHLILVQVETQAVLDFLTEEFQKQFECAGRELCQTQELLKDAIDTLITSFSNIYAHVNAQQSLTLARARSNSKAWPASTEEMAADFARMREISAQLEIDINAAVRSLQFQDLTSQLLDHALGRVDAMNNALAEIKSMPGDVCSDPVSFIERLNLQRRSILQQVGALDAHKTNPVSQGHMATGEVELF